MPLLHQEMLERRPTHVGRAGWVLPFYFMTQAPGPDLVCEAKNFGFQRPAHFLGNSPFRILDDLVYRS